MITPYPVAQRSVARLRRAKRSIMVADTVVWLASAAGLHCERCHMLFGMRAGVRKAESSSCCICEGGQLVDADGCASAAAAAGKGYCSRTYKSQGGKQQGVRCVAVTVWLMSVYAVGLLWSNNSKIASLCWHATARQWCCCQPCW